MARSQPDPDLRDIPTVRAYEVRWRAEENLREAFRVMARCAADGAILETDGVCHIATGIPNAFFNPVFLPRTSLPPDDIGAFQARARAFYAARGGLPWTLLLPAYEGEEPVLSPARLQDAGMMLAGTIPLLTRPATRARDLLPGNRYISVEPVRGDDLMCDHRRIVAESFGLPPYIVDLLMPDLPAPTMRLFVAFDGEDPIGTISLFEAAGVLGIYNLGVRPGSRRAGVGTMLLRHALNLGAQTSGAEDFVVQAPRAVLPLFRAMGFRRLGVCARFVEPQHIPPAEGKKRE
jgi:GNAT superfamily N-acetyltransferase